MDRRSQLGYALVALGVVTALLTVTVGGSTARACPDIDGPVYDAVGVAPGSVAVTGFEVTTMTLAWYDGCNWRTNSLLPLGVGVPVVVVGLLLARRAAPGGA